MPFTSRIIFWDDAHFTRTCSVNELGYLTYCEYSYAMSLLGNDGMILHKRLVATCRVGRRILSMILKLKVKVGPPFGLVR